MGLPTRSCLQLFKRCTALTADELDEGSDFGVWFCKFLRNYHCKCPLRVGARFSGLVLRKALKASQGGTHWCSLSTHMLPVPVKSSPNTDCGRFKSPYPRKELFQGYGNLSLRAESRLSLRRRARRYIFAKRTFSSIAWILGFESNERPSRVFCGLLVRWRYVLGRLNYFGQVQGFSANQKAIAGPAIVSGLVRFVCAPAQADSLRYDTKSFLSDS